MLVDLQCLLMGDIGGCDGVGCWRVRVRYADRVCWCYVTRVGRPPVPGT